MCWAYATLAVIAGATANAKEIVEIRIDGARVGQLTPASSAHFIPAIRALETAGKVAAAQVIVKGNTIRVEVVLFAARAHELGDAWVREHTAPAAQAATPTRWTFNPAPGWPTPPPEWVPDATWRPPAEWPPAPPGWRFWIELPH